MGKSKSRTRGQSASTAQATGGPRVASLARRRQSPRPSLAALAALLVAAQPDLATLDAVAAGAGSESASAIGLVELARSKLGVEQGGVIAVEPDSDSLLPLAIAGVPSALATLWRSRATGAHLGAFMNDAHTADLRAGRALIIRWERTPLDQCLFFGMPSALVAPMRVGDQLVGLLGLRFAGEEHLPTADEIAAAHILAAYAAAALDRERLLREYLAIRSSVAVLRDDQLLMQQALEHTAHELKGPVTAISSNIQIAQRRLQRLQERGAPHNDAPHATTVQEVQGLLRSAKEKIDLLRQLALDLEEAARMEVRKLELHVAQCDLLAIIHSAVEDHRHLAPARTISLQPSNLTAIPISADAVRVGQVLGNYLSNAIKYSPTECPIAVAVEIETDCVRVAVRDEGPGLPAYEHDRIWERLYRSETVGRQTGPVDGLGLGLFISRAIVEEHGGQVGVESAPGAGSTFWFRLPLVPPQR